MTYSVLSAIMLRGLGSVTDAKRPGVGDRGSAPGRWGVTGVRAPKRSPFYLAGSKCSIHGNNCNSSCHPLVLNLDWAQR